MHHSPQFHFTSTIYDLYNTRIFSQNIGTNCRTIIGTFHFASLRFLFILCVSFFVSQWYFLLQYDFWWHTLLSHTIEWQRKGLLQQKFPLPVDTLSYRLLDTNIKKQFYSHTQKIKRKKKTMERRILKQRPVVRMVYILRARLLARNNIQGTTLFFVRTQPSNSHS